MEENLNREEKIERYINNLLPDAEKSSFEKEMAEDNELKAEVFSLSEWKRLFANHKPHEWEQKITQQIQEDKEPVSALPAKKKAKTISIKHALAIAAALLLVLTASVFYLISNKVDVVQLAKENSLDGLNKASVRKGDSIAVADVLFDSGDYSNYLTEAFSILKENPDSMQRSVLNINICKSYIQLNRADKAILFYQSLSNKEKAYCYLRYQAALAYTITKSKTEAIRLFKSVIENGCFPVDKKATEWIEKLK